MSKRFVLPTLIVSFLCAMLVIAALYSEQMPGETNDRSGAESAPGERNVYSSEAAPATMVPPEILAKLPTQVSARIRKDGFESLPPEMRERILQLMKGTPAVQSPQGTAAGNDLPPTGERYKHLVPLADLKNGTYQGFEGGLYAGGSNKPSSDYLKIGMESASKVRPLDASGKPDENGGIIGLLTVGFSNTTMESQSFLKAAKADPQKNPNVVIVDGAVGGRDAIELSDPKKTRYWDEVKERLDKASLTPAQVQAIWLKEVVAGDTMPFPQNAERFRDSLTTIVGTLKSKFPNLHLVYVSSRIYGGYALRNGSQEPWAYEGGFAYKWMIEEWEKGLTPGDPWVAWGPYLWANGSTPRSDGLVWDLSDFVESDQMHPGPAGTAKVASMLADFFKTDPTATLWYLKKTGANPS